MCLQSGGGATRASGGARALGSARSRPLDLSVHCSTMNGLTGRKSAKASWHFSLDFQREIRIEIPCDVFDPTAKVIYSYRDNYVAISGS